jgi:hypothetical protein
MIVGYKIAAGAASVLVAIGLVFWLIHFIQDTGKTELKLESLQEQLEVRSQIDEAIRTAPSDVDAALELLRRRQGAGD